MTAARQRSISARRHMDRMRALAAAQTEADRTPERDAANDRYWLWEACRDSTPATYRWEVARAIRDPDMRRVAADIVPGLTDDQRDRLRRGAA